MGGKREEGVVGEKGEEGVVGCSGRKGRGKSECGIGAPIIKAAGDCQ